MNRFYLIILAIILSFACKKQKSDTAMTTAQPLYSGTFVQQAHATSGTAKVVLEMGNRRLYFENFATSGGQDLRVYLSRDLTNSDFIEVAKLQAISGNQFYDVQTSTNLDFYNNVLIWSPGNSLLYGYATLKR